METLQQALAQQRNPLLVLFNNFNSLRSSALLEYLKLPVPLRGWEAVNLNKPVRQARKSSERFELKHSYYVQETY